MGEADFSDEEKLAVREHPGVWFDSFGFVSDREKTLRKADPSNSIQRELFKIYAWCQDNKVPCNIIGLKSRKEGLSTGATALAYHHLCEHTAEAVVIGTDHETSDTLTNMVRRYAEHDQFPWGTKLSWKESENRGTWTHGSELKRDTAIDPKAGRSSTVQVLIATEVAHWPSSGVRSADETMLSILNSMPDIANLLRVVDSTANGASGWFYDTYTDAVTFEERKAGKLGNGWIKVFEPWHANPLRSSVITDPQRREIASTLTEREKAGASLYGWNEGQIQWRRETLKTKCGNDEAKFDQEYPESEQVAFLTSGSPRFNVAIVAEMLRTAEDSWKCMERGEKGHGQLGHLRKSGTGIHFMATPEDSWLWMIEPPTRGRSYILPCDPMTGEQSIGAKVRDRHAPCIIRGPYADEFGQVHVPEVVAVLHDAEGCRWEMDVLADRMAILHEWYGACMVVPEVNKAMDLIPLLRARNVAPLYHRPMKPDASNPSQKQKAVGFYTSESTRNLWVNALAEAIRENAIECLYPQAIRDWQTFIVTESGRAEAAPKKFDDWCASVGIGLLTLPSATLYSRIPNTPSNQPTRVNRQAVTTAMSRFGACGLFAAMCLLQ